MTCVILQSYCEDKMTPWIERCLESVRSWADAQDYGYEFLGDELFDLTPEWYRTKLGDRMPIIADLARLNWIAKTLEAGAEVVVWLDADTLVFRPAGLTVEIEQTCVFGLENWLQTKQNKPRLYRNVHNAYLGFRRDCPVLPFLQHATLKMIDRVDEEHIAPQFVGPKLLTHLNNLIGLQTDERFGAISPLLASELVAGSPGAEHYLANVQAANLCLSLDDQIEHDELLEALLRMGMVRA